MPRSAKLTSNEFLVRFCSRVYDNDDYTMLRSLLRFPTYRTFNDLLDNYDPQLGRAEVESSQEKAEIDRFVDAIFATHVANLTFQFVQNTGKFNSRSQFQDYVKQTWFGGFRRGGSSPTVLDSSAFEHVFLGERNSEKMTSGLHSWIQYLLQERAGYMHYCGWHDNTVRGQLKCNVRKSTRSRFFKVRRIAVSMRLLLSYSCSRRF